MDISSTIEPKSDQLDAAELTEPRTFIIESVSKGNAEQPVKIHLQGFPRPWKPSKNVRRVLVACWGKDASQYAGKAVKLYCDPDVVYAGQKVGGIRIAALSHIDGPRQVATIPTRGKSQIVTVQPLQMPTSPPSVSDEQIEFASTVDELRALWAGADEIQREAIQTRVKQLQEGMSE